MLLQQSLPSKCSVMFRKPSTRFVSCGELAVGILTGSREPARRHSLGRDFATQVARTRVGTAQAYPGTAKGMRCRRRPASPASKLGIATIPPQMKNLRQGIAGGSGGFMKKSDISLVMVGRATDTQFVHDRLMLVNHTTDSSFKIKASTVSRRGFG